ncbi:GNAT family N-acetyltransferase [Muriicola jejuensis]|uniref:GNAT family N-acetyltransferase n=1 Tax=Muriicola jejuensis TaxID=504488 RepID=A0A6P0UBL5_9FLAO|nr:GNAT family N-acetyltransferase [Muriicola jejuensis]NER10417.1 GNAT family N-acetyltransferase [Muriicola jejuensis]
MEYVELCDIRFGFTKDYKHDHNLRRSFNQLTEVTFGFTLEDWYREGFWGDYYIPYSLLHRDQVISNVSINRIEFDFENERKVGIQIGTVMTDEKYRHRGLNRFIMERVMNEWKDHADFIYLFANDTVLDFYPKFNFQIVEEYQHSKKIDTQSTSTSWKKLNMEDQTDLAFLTKMVKESVPISQISMRNNASLIMFYCKSYKRNSVFYVEELNAITIAHFEGNTLYLDDVFSIKPLDINDVIQAMADESITQVALGFTPLDESGFEKHLLKGTDTLFMLKDTYDLFTNKHWMFPVLSHA